MSDRYFIEAKKKLETFGFEVLATAAEYKTAKIPIACLCPKKIHNVKVSVANADRGCVECNKYQRKLESYNECKAYLKSINYTTEITVDEYVNKNTSFPGKCCRDHDIDINMQNLLKGSSCCKQCGVISRQETYMNNTGYAHPAQNPEIKEKITQTHLERRGVRHQMHDPTVKEKIKNTNLERRNVPHPSQDPIVKQKKIDTNMERRNVPHPSQDPVVKQKKIDTNMERRNVPYASQDPIVKAKMAASHLALTNSDSVKTNNYKMKTYTFPSGKQTLFQGYENMCLDDLIQKEGYSEEDILNLRKDMPPIYYVYNENEHRYFPDIYIKKDKKIIEVKCEYFFNKTKEIDLLKQKACLELGYKHEIRIYDRKGNYYVYQE